MFVKILRVQNYVVCLNSAQKRVWGIRGCEGFLWTRSVSRVFRITVQGRFFRCGVIRGCRFSHNFGRRRDIRSGRVYCCSQQGARRRRKKLPPNKRTCEGKGDHGCGHSLRSNCTNSSSLVGATHNRGFSLHGCLRSLVCDGRCYICVGFLLFVPWFL